VRADDPVLYAEADGVATITLNRPDRLNAMNDDLLQHWLASLERAGDRESVRVVVVTGAGRAFCVGGDLTGGAGGGVADDPTPRSSCAVSLMRRWRNTAGLSSKSARCAVPR
jgi:2-(1,2-epoxy-1,2-dihydrophenyl)acetyl-CoA isomerase